MATVRICLCGDEKTGKSSLVTSLVKDVFVTNKIQPVLPQITIPPSLGTPENVTTTIVDTSAVPTDRETLNREIKKCNVILLVYADHYSYERIALFWLPHFRSLAVNVPVILCANKSDLTKKSSTEQIIQDEMLPVMAEFKEIDACIRTSALEHHNINEAFFLCQKAVTDPVAPLFDSKELVLKPSCIAALGRIFHLCDHDQDGYLSDDEIQAFQNRCFGKPLSPVDLDNIKANITKQSQEGISEKGISESGFILLSKMFAEKGRHETIWLILRNFHYSNSLSLESSFASPKFDIPSDCSAELSPAGYRFFVDLFLLHDKDNDGGLSPPELNSLFQPAPGLPASWSDEGSTTFPSSTISNESGHITLQGWLAQWSMTTFFSPKTTLTYLAYLGYDPPGHNITSALVVTKPRKRNTSTSSFRRNTKLKTKTERNVLLAYLLGPPLAGKSSLLAAFLSRPFSPTYFPTIKPRTAVNTVELAGGRQYTLILSELGDHEPSILENSAKLSTADLLVFVYDSSDPDSFTYISNLRATHAHLAHLPSLFVASKADLDRCTQRSEVQPEEYTAGLGLPKPLHVSSAWGSIGEVFVGIAEAAVSPGMAMPVDQFEGSVKRSRDAGAGQDGNEDDDERSRQTTWWIAGGAGVVVLGAAIGIWRRTMRY